MIVLFFGGTDAQAIQIDGTWHSSGRTPWLAEYRGEVGDLMAELDEDGRDVYGWAFRSSVPMTSARRWRFSTDLSFGGGSASTIQLRLQLERVHRG